MFAFRLCLSLGFAHPDHLLSSMTSSQFAEWIDFATIEPIGEIRDEIRHGQIMALTANINRDARNHPDPYQATEFMNFIDRPKDPAEDTPEARSLRIKSILQSRKGAKK